MRIISKFKDYYDGVQSYGQDQELVYIRNRDYPEDVNIKLIDHFDSEGRFYIRETYPYILQHPAKDVEQSHVKSFIIGFCGTLYRGHIIKWKEHIYTSDTDKEILYICYNQEELSEFQRETEYSKSHKHKHYTRKRSKYERETDYFKVDNQDKLKEIFFRYKTPCFIIYDREDKYQTNLTINPDLSKYQFYRVKDAFTTFQDISMYLSGVLGVNAPVLIEISNESMAEKKGFGHKYAFRKEPENKDKIKV